MVLENNGWRSSDPCAKDFLARNMEPHEERRHAPPHASSRQQINNGKGAEPRIRTIPLLPSGNIRKAYCCRPPIILLPAISHHILVYFSERGRDEEERRRIDGDDAKNPFY
eukprot:scaffold4973_cov135-Cylindrotheca_fusiformis.AAC.17